MSLPKKLHQVWIGSHMPVMYREWTARVKRMNPDWEHRLWGNELLERYAEDPFVAWMVSTNERKAFLVDRLRVLLLRDEGGLYADVDCYPVRPLRMLASIWDDPRIQFVAGMRPPDRRGVSLSAPGVAFIDNTVLASVPVGDMAKRLCDLYRADARRHTGFSMGREIIRNADERTVLLNWRFFYSDSENPDAIFLHDSLNMGSWLKPNPESAPIP